MVPGGDVRPGENAMVGDLASRVFAQRNFDLYVMSVGGVDAGGLTDFDPADVAEGAITAGLATANSVKVSKDWHVQKIVRPKAGRR